MNIKWAYIGQRKKDYISHYGRSSTIVFQVQRSTDNRIVEIGRRELAKRISQGRLAGWNGSVWSSVC